MAKEKGNFSRLTWQDRYWDGLDNNKYGVNDFEIDLKREIYYENKSYKEYIEDCWDDYYLMLMDGSIKKFE